MKNKCYLILRLFPLKEKEKVKLPKKNRAN